MTQQAKPISIIEIQVNGHAVKVTTDQKVTPEYIRSIERHIKAVEFKTAPKVRR